MFVDLLPSELGGLEVPLTYTCHLPI